MSEASKNKPTISTIELTNRDVLAMEQTLGKIATSSEIGTKAAYRISRLLDKIRPETEAFNKARTEIVKKIGTPNKDNPDNYDIPPERRDELNTEIDGILDHSFEIKFIKLDIATLDKVKLSALEINSIKKLVDFSEYDDEFDDEDSADAEDNDPKQDDE